MHDAGYDTCHVAAVGPLIVIRRLRQHDLSQYVFIIRTQSGDSDEALPAVHLDGCECSVKFSFTFHQTRPPYPVESHAFDLAAAWSTVETASSVQLSLGDLGFPLPFGSISRGASSVQIRLNKLRFTEGCVLALHTVLREEGAAVIQNCSFDNVFQAVQDAVQELDEHDIAFALFCCDPEELASSHNARGCYAVNGSRLAYAGIHGFCSAFDEVRSQSRVNMDHEVLQHFQQGLWSLEYTANRLKESSRTRGLAPFYQQLAGDLLLAVPSAHWPRALDSIFCASAHALHHRLLSMCGGFSGDCLRRVVGQLFVSAVLCILINCSFL
jgi:hypothetical protein